MDDFGGVGLIGEDAQERAADVDFGILAGFVDDHGGWVSGTSQAEAEGFGIEQSVAASGELEVAEVLSDHVGVKLFEGFAGFDESVGVAFDAFGYDGAFDEHGEQSGGHAVSDGVGDVETDVVFIEAHDVVNVTADPGGGSEDVGEFYAGDFGHFAGQEIALESGGELHFFVDLGEVVVKGLADHAEAVNFLGEFFNGGLDLHQGSKSSGGDLGRFGLGYDGEAFGVEMLKDILDINILI